MNQDGLSSDSAVLDLTTPLGRLGAFETLEHWADSNAQLQFVPPATEEVRDFIYRSRVTGQIFIHADLNKLLKRKKK